MLVARNQVSSGGCEAIRTYLSRAGRESWIPTHPPALANHALLVKVHPAKLLQPKSHSLSWIVPLGKASQHFIVQRCTISGFLQ